MSLSETQQLNWIYELYQLGLSNTHINNSNPVYEPILRHVLEGFNADTGSLALFQADDSQHLTIVAAVGLPKECVGKEITQGHGIIGWIVEHKQALLLAGNVEKDPRFHLETHKHPSEIPHTSLCWPLMVGQQMIGVLCLNRLGNQVHFTEADLNRWQILANLIALVIDNIRLHNDQHQRIQQLAESQEHNTESNRLLQEAQARLMESESRLFGILNSIDSVVWAMEPHSLKLLYLNKAAYELSGRTVEEFLNTPQLWLDIIHAADRQRVLDSLQLVLQTEVQKVMYRIYRTNGELRWLFHHIRLVRDEHQMPLRIDGITVDITQHKQAEDLLKQRNAELQSALDKIQEVQRQLVQSEKLSSIGQLAAGVAHEINNPIGYINSNLTSLKKYVEELLDLIENYEHLESTCTDKDLLEQISAFKKTIDLKFTKMDIIDLLNESQEGAARVKKIVQDLKDFSHAGGDDDWQWADLHACLESTLNIVNNEIKYKAIVIKEFGNIPLVWCLPHQLNQVFMNLLVNAAHAIEKEGTITLRTGENENNLWIEVIDNGKGIAPEHIDKIFDPFFTTKPVGQGTGLGLSVSYNIIKKHLGEIQIDSTLGIGTRFRILLPKKNEEAEA
jgi:PAS domain S-box-containing protein